MIGLAVTRLAGLAPHQPGPAWRRVRLQFVVVAALAAAAGLGASVSLRFPEVLIDGGSFGTALVRSSAAAGVVSLLGLVALGAAFVVVSRTLAQLVPVAMPGRRLVLWCGQGAGLSWVAGALSGLVLVPLWAGDVDTGVPLLTGFSFGGAAVVAPLLSAAWTLGVVRCFRGARVLGIVGAACLMVTAGRSVVWVLNARALQDEGFYVTSAGLTIVALLGYPTWILWIVRTGFLLGEPDRTSGALRRLGTGSVAAVLILLHALVMVLATPTPRTHEVPTVPSAAGAVRYAVMLALADQFALPADYEQLLAARRRSEATQPEYPADVLVRHVDAGGVPAEYICARGASTDRVAMYLPGGGFVMPPSTGDRAFAADISRESRACVLMLHYRLAPEHPYPAAMQDGVRAYRWLRRQGVAASRTAIFGESAGGNLALATALALRDGGDPLPAALVSISAVTDFTFTGRTFRSKDHAETLITRANQDFVRRSYLAAADRRDPGVSPVYADPAGLPPTLLMVGSQEVLLSDVTRMADRMRAANVPVRLEVWPGMPHSWHSARKPTMETRLAVRHVADFIAHRLA